MRSSSVEFVPFGSLSGSTSRVPNRGRSTSSRTAFFDSDALKYTDFVSHIVHIVERLVSRAAGYDDALADSTTSLEKECE